MTEVLRTTRLAVLLAAVLWCVSAHAQEAPPPTQPAPPQPTRPQSSEPGPQDASDEADPAEAGEQEPLPETLPPGPAPDAGAQPPSPREAEPRRPRRLGQGDAAALYRRLSSVGLDAEQVYVVREGYLDREDVRIMLTDGIIGFMREVDGRVTGAYFEGEGEILVMPPDRAERNSLGLFIGQAVLQERFVSGYFRFNDDAFHRLQPDLRRRVDGTEFVARNQAAVMSLAEGDALRLLRTFINTPPGSPTPPGDRMLRARLGGERLGIFDVFFDTTLREQIWVGQVAYTEGWVFFDRWLAFPMRSLRRDLEEAQKRGRRTDPPPAIATRNESDIVQVSEYQLRAEVRPPQDLEVEAELWVEALEPGHRMLIFELSRFLELQSVESGGQPLEVIQNEAVEGTELARRGNDLVAVIFPQALEPGVRHRLRFVYRGSVMSAAGGGLLYVGARGIWYPNVGVALADFDLTFRYPAEWTLVATGEPVSERAEEHWKVSRWVTERPIALAGFNLGQYERASARAGSVRVETYAARAMEDAFRPPPAPVIVPRPTRRNPMGRAVAMTPPPSPQPARNAQMVAEQAARTVEFLSERFGPYPYRTLTISQMPGRDSQGWPTLVFLSSYAFLTLEEKAALRLQPYEVALFGSLVQAHETAHQWWGDAVLWATYRDQWLVESLANYSALLQLEQESPEQFDLVLEQYRRELLSRSRNDREVVEAGPVTLGVRLSSSKFPRGYDVITYGRGTWLLHMLRHMFLDASRGKDGEAALRGTPEEPFIRALRRVRERYEGRALSTEGFRRVLEEELPRELHFDGEASLEWFFDEWVEGISIPSLELEGVRIARQKGRLVATGRIVQKHAPDTIVTSVPLWAQTQHGQRFVGRVFAEGEDSSFTLAVPPGTRRLLLDPEKTLLTRP